MATVNPAALTEAHERAPCYRHQPQRPRPMPSRFPVHLSLPTARLTQLRTPLGVFARGAPFELLGEFLTAYIPQPMLRCALADGLAGVYLRDPYNNPDTARVVFSGAFGETACDRLARYFHIELVEMRQYNANGERQYRTGWFVIDPNNFDKNREP